MQATAIVNLYVIFDLDGTLVETEQVWRDVRRDFVVTTRALERRGCDDDDRDAHQRMGALYPRGSRRLARRIQIADEVIAGHRAVTKGPGSTRGERSARPAGANASPSSFLPTRSRGKARARRHREFAPDPQALFLATRTITSLDTLDASSVRAVLGL